MRAGPGVPAGGWGLPQLQAAKAQSRSHCESKSQRLGRLSARSLLHSPPAVTAPDCAPAPPRTAPPASGSLWHVPEGSGAWGVRGPLPFYLEDPTAARTASPPVLTRLSSMRMRASNSCSPSCHADGESPPSPEGGPGERALALYFPGSSRTRLSGPPELARVRTFSKRRRHHGLSPS